jgi:hypothetical protein
MVRHQREQRSAKVLFSGTGGGGVGTETSSKFGDAVRRIKEGNCLSVLTPSTPFGVSAGHITSFRVVSNEPTPAHDIVTGINEAMREQVL